MIIVNKLKLWEVHKEDFSCIIYIIPKSKKKYELIITNSAGNTIHYEKFFRFLEAKKFALKYHLIK